MKAWSVTDDCDERTFVWADTRSEAKSLAKLEDGFEDTLFTKIRAVRFPDLDGEPPAGHYWDDDRVRLIMGARAVSSIRLGIGVTCTIQ